MSQLENCLTNKNVSSPVISCHLRLNWLCSQGWKVFLATSFLSDFRVGSCWNTYSPFKQGTNSLGFWGPSQQQVPAWQQFDRPVWGSQAYPNHTFSLLIHQKPMFVFGVINLVEQKLHQLNFKLLTLRLIFLNNAWHQNIQHMSHPIFWVVTDFNVKTTLCAYFGDRLKLKCHQLQVA